MQVPRPHAAERGLSQDTCVWHRLFGPHDKRSPQLTPRTPRRQRLQPPCLHRKGGIPEPTPTSHPCQPPGVSLQRNPKTRSPRTTLPSQHAGPHCGDTGALTLRPVRLTLQTRGTRTSQRGLAAPGRPDQEREPALLGLAFSPH